jgi:hypothetical protein
MTDRATTILFGGDQGHDSQIVSFAVDMVAGNVSMALRTYAEGQTSADRVAIQISFVDVESLVSSADLRVIADNARAGNVRYWQIAESGGTSHFYLSGGYIAITSRAAPTLNFV